MDDLKRAAVAALETLPGEAWPEVVVLAYRHRVAGWTLEQALDRQGGGQ